MKITILTDNHAGAHTLAEHGLSYFIEHEGLRILFDAGQSDVFMRNAVSLGLDISKPDYIVLSHGHFDHGGGLRFMDGGRLVCHPGSFRERYRKDGELSIGLMETKEEMEKRFYIISTDKPFSIAENIVFLGEIPRTTDFESKTTGFIFEDGSEDFVTDDSALAIRLEEGIFVVTGCGHAGIVNTLEHAKEVMNTAKIAGIAGGFHLKHNNQQTKETIAYLQKNNVQHIYPSHCTALPALLAFSEFFPIRQLHTGDVINL
jgi:7,8-dihydropterin-6-yl-methyl-4-(beta-D-ribofuranosyl)aminobenzene 5'-phosphate synthase